MGQDAGASQLYGAPPNDTGAGASTGYAEGNRRASWRWLFPPLVLMLSAGLAGIFFIPANPDLVVPVQVWLFLCVGIGILAGIRANSQLGSPAQTGIRYRANGQPIVWNKKRYLRVLAMLGGVMAILGAVTLLFAFGNSSFYEIQDLTGTPFGFVSAALLTSLLVSFFGFVPRGRIRDVLESRAGNWALMILAVLGCAGAAGYTPSLLRPQPYTSFASWPSLVQFATHEAEKIHKQAVIELIEARLPFWMAGVPGVDSPYSSRTTPFEVRFYFVSPDGQSSTIGVLDSDPPRLESLDSSPTAGSPISQEELTRFAQRLLYMKIGPRDVYSLTERDGWAIAQGPPLAHQEPHVRMDQAFEPPGHFGVTATWEMFYEFSEILTVDAATGKILQRRNVDLDATPTPAPATAPGTTPTPTRGP